MPTAQRDDLAHMDRTFEIPAPDLRLVMLMPALGLIAGIVGLSLAAREEPRVWLLAPVIAGAVGLILWSIRRRRVALDGDMLDIRAGINSARVKVAALDLDGARIVDLDDVSTLRPMLKTFGTAMPGYRAGHFRLRDRSRAFLLVTDPHKVLAVREHDGRMLLLSLQRPQAALDALRSVAQGTARR